MTKEDAEKPGCNKTKVFVWFLRVVKVISILALLVSAVSYCLQMKASVTSELNNFDKAFSLMSSLGYVILCLIMVITELELEMVISRVPVLKFWFVRGLALCWLGVQTIHSAEQLASAISATVSHGESENFTLASQICGWTLIGIASLYLIMTITCMHKIFGLDSLNDIDATLVVRHEGGGNSRSSESVSRNKSSSSGGGSSKEDAEIISNMSIALNITSREARSRFAGTGGADEARSMRALAMKASSAKFDDADDYNNSKKKQADYSAPLIVSTSGEAPSAYSPTNGGGDDDDDDNPRARRQREQDALDAAYYANQQ